MLLRCSPFSVLTVVESYLSLEMVLLPESPRCHFSRSSAGGGPKADNVLPYGKHHPAVCLLQNTPKRVETPL